MNTAQSFYEVYKTLPKSVQREVTELITHENDEYIQVSVSALVEGLKELKDIKEGKKKSRPVAELLKELKNGM